MKSKNNPNTNNDKKRSASTNKIPKEKIDPKESESVKEFLKGSDFINSLIHEYLLKRDFLKTLDIFQEEVNLKIKNKQYNSTKFSDFLNDTVIESYFNGGKKNDFFKFWNRLVPSHIKSREIILEKLEFFLQIYFAIYPLLPSVVGDKKNIKENHLKELKIRMQEFKGYLESKEVEMSKTTEYLAYYALPYVQNPREHPSYKPIFTNEWVKELKEKLKTCLINYVPTGKYPLLYDMYMTCEANSLSDNKVIKSRPLYHFLENYNINQESVISHPNLNTEISNQNVSKIIEDLNKIKRKEEMTKLTLIESQKKWTNFSLDLLNISFELINNFKSEKIPQEDYIESTFNKLQKYEAFLKKNAEELEKNVSFNREHLETQENIKDNSNNYEIILTKNNKSQNISQLDISHNKSHINQSIHINYDPNFMLDMQSIKSLFAKVNAYGYDTKEFYEKINFIIREIRMRISRRKYIKIKQISLYSVIFYDLLGLRSKHVKIFQNLITNPNTVLEALKLMNVITNENRGRTYMLSKPSLLEEIVNLMIGEDSDSEVRQNCLGIVQKFTLRSEPQKKLIELDVISWITNVFVIESGGLSEYTLEYGLALLMNLSLRSTGREKCEKVSDKLLKIMIGYFHSESIQVRTCINGTLFSLLKRNKIKNEAKLLGLEKMLNSQLQDPNEQMKKQIQYILDELNNDVEQEEKFDEEFEDENYGDEEEEAYEDDYYEEDSISDDLIGLHYHILGQFIIRNLSDNEHETQKIFEFINTTNKINNKNLMSNVSNSIRIIENDRPLRRPTTPMTNLSSTSNSQIFNQERRSIASKMKANLRSVNVKVELNNEENYVDDDNEINHNNYNNNDQEEVEINNNVEKGRVYSANKDNRNIDKSKLDPNDFEIGFIKKDKIARTPNDSLNL